MKRAFKWMTYVSFAGAVVWLVILVLRPEPVIVDVGRVVYGSLEVTVDSEGKTRRHDNYLVSAPVSGKLRRVRAKIGNAVKKGQKEVVAALKRLRAAHSDDTEYKKLRKDLPKEWHI